MALELSDQEIGDLFYETLRGRPTTGILAMVLQSVLMEVCSQVGKDMVARCPKFQEALEEVVKGQARAILGRVQVVPANQESPLLHRLRETSPSDMDNVAAQLEKGNKAR